MDNILEACTSWKQEELDYLKLYIEARNKVRSLSSEEINANPTYRTLIYNTDDGIEVDNPAILKVEREQYLAYIYFWLALLSTPNSSIIDLACFRNEFEVFIEDLTLYINDQVSDETESCKSKATPEEKPELKNEASVDLPCKRVKRDI